MVSRGKINVRTIILIVLAVFATAFAIMNASTWAHVWPFGIFRLTFVIALSFGLGVGVGLVGNSLVGLIRSRPAPQLEGIPPLKAGEREHPGRP